jgi:methylated-DNA-[protein]-cysteine S-methyltransferase
VSSELVSARIKTPIGNLWVVAMGRGVWGAELEPRWVALALRLWKKGVEVEPGTVRRRDDPIIARAARALADYFAGELSTLTRVPLALEGSERRLAVWRRVRKIRPGSTMTYGALAESVGMSGAFRAVGAANSANPCALFVPCHRVVSSDGGLVGWGAGVDAKKWLLAHEGASY